MKKLTIDLDKFTGGVADFANIILNMSREHGAILESDPPESQRLADMEMIFRFATIALWYPEKTKSGNVAVTRQSISREVLSDGWLDSPEALEAAAVIAVRHGSGINVIDDKIRGARYVNVFNSCAAVAATRHGHIAEMTNARMAIECCVQAFEEKK